jgi:hypothetical protein
VVFCKQNKTKHRPSVGLQRQCAPRATPSSEDPDVSSQPGNKCLSSRAPLHVRYLPLSHVRYLFTVVMNNIGGFLLLQVRNSNSVITTIQWFHVRVTAHSLFHLFLVSMLPLTLA